MYFGGRANHSARQEASLQTVALMERSLADIFPHREVLEEPRSHDVCGHFGKDSSLLLSLLVLVVLIPRAWRCEAVVKTVSWESAEEEGIAAGERERSHVRRGRQQHKCTGTELIPFHCIIITQRSVPQKK